MSIIPYLIVTFVLISHILHTNGYRLEPRIVNGHSSEAGQFSYFAHLEIYVDEYHENDFICGGSVISQRFILTAAHCVYYALRILAVLGAHDLRERSESGRKVYSISYRNVFIHPSYNPEELLNDLALVEFPHAIQFNRRVTKIALPAHIENAYLSRRNVIAIGLGLTQTQYAAIPNIIQYIELETTTFEECQQSFKFLSGDNGTIVCAKGENGRSVYEGDSGGPLVYRNTVIGVASFINSIDISRPQAFTYVVPYLPWINDIIHSKH